MSAICKISSIFFFFFFLFFLHAHCIPAKRKLVSLSLADGTTVQARLCGDELVHYYRTSDGRAFAQNPLTNQYERIDEIQFQKQWKSRRAARQSQRMRRQKQMQNISHTRTTSSQQKRGLVILVNFSDYPMTYTATDYNDFFNKLGYSTYGMSGSVRDYFLSQSYGALDVQFDVVGPVTVSEPLAYYGQNDSYGMDKYPAEMVIEACLQVDSLVDFSRYDWNGDGEVEQVYVIYAGYGEAQNAPPHTIWPHEYSLNEAYLYGDGGGEQILDGVKVNTYACSCELAGNSGAQIDPIGTACHEFSHCLNLPDTYDVNYNAFGMDQWDLMDYGAYNNDGRTPAGFTAWERMYCGWLQPIELRSERTIYDMQPLTSAPEAYILYNQANRNEYYLLENRQNEGWDAALKGHGLLVVHVDYDANAWASNKVNAVSSHQRMTIIPANNNYRGINVITSMAEYNAAMAGNPYPGTSGNTELTDYSLPASTLFNVNSHGEKFMNAPITDITEIDGYISFSFSGVYIHVPSPLALPATDLSTDGFVAHWTPVDEAVFYEVVLMANDSISEDTSEVELRTSFMKRAGVQTLYQTTDTTMSFSSLDPKFFYSYMVRAVTQEASSEWSNSIEVPLKSQSVSICLPQAELLRYKAWYDLQGRRILTTQPKPGLYIKNGKKIFIR